MDGDSKSDSTVSDSVTSPTHLASTPRVSLHIAGRQLLNESGIERALELTVATIIESEDSNVLGSDTDIGKREREDTRGLFSIAVAKTAGANRTQGHVHRLYHLIQPVIFW